MNQFTSWLLVIEAIKLAVFLFLWFYCGIAFWTLVAWGLGIGLVISVVVAVVWLVQKGKANNGHGDRG